MSGLSSGAAPWRRSLHEGVALAAFGHVGVVLGQRHCGFLSGRLPRGGVLGREGRGPLDHRWDAL
jgi:hypothetical protein